jgi:uncharacterized 2Fe-2S/4Fe-4S cluster protein (DUF4445 family)
MTVQLSINHHAIEATPGATVFDLAEKLDVRVPTSCNKNGKCRECLVEVVRGMELLSPPAAEEEHLTGKFRLSCRAHILPEASGEIECHTMRRGAMRVEHEAMDLPVREGMQALLDPTVTRDGDRILLDGEEIAISSAPIHGLAIDIGTTTCVVRLHNLETGEILATSSFENPQRFGGTDVMSRIRYDTDNKGKLLQRTLLGYLNHTIEALPVDTQTIYEIVIAGNSTMRDLFFGLNVYSIGQRPYRSLTQHELEEGKRTSTTLAVTAKSLRLPVNPKARVYSLPLLHGHIGADAAACLLAVDLMHEDRTVALMDIGTNTELLLGNKDKIYVASAPAGPAFEGGAIACGMPGLQGAIEKITLDASGTAQFEVIGEEAPQGICGSGLIDLLSELLRTEKMDQFGRYEDGSEKFMIAPQDNVYLAESDINELAQAKGANVAGLQILLASYGITFDDLDVFYIAGGFGRHINVEAARRIGLIPDLPSEKIVKVGNAAIEGVSMALLSRTRREQLEKAALNTKHVELETDPNFFDYFVAGCQFQPFDSYSLERLE